MSLRIVVAGLAATFPVGGPFWDYMQYLLGFHAMGHDVLYIEDTGQWFYSPVQQTYVASGAESAAFLGTHLERLSPDLKHRWYLRDSCDNEFGRTREWVRDFCAEADIFLNISAACWMRDDYLRAQRVAFIDSDPMYTQAGFPDYQAGGGDEGHRTRIDALLNTHDVFLTFGENIHQADCRIPRGLVDWHPTRQPITIEAFQPYARPVAARRRVLTTVGSWEPTKKPGVLVGDTLYYGKSVEMERFSGLAARSALPIEIAAAGDFPRAALEAQGWRFASAASASRDPWVYRDFLATSWGEWSVAKNAYVAGRTGWFSCRTACYLALGVPAVVQDTGFSRFLPVGEGLLAFTTEEEALDGIAAIAAEPERHTKAALDVAHEYFDARRVLQRLIDDVQAAPRRRARP